MTTKLNANSEKQYQAMVEEIASNIAMLSRQVAALLNGRLKKKTIIILLAHCAGMGQRDVEKVLEAIVGMEKELLK